jgi:hypothetical protein
METDNLYETLKARKREREIQDIYENLRARVAAGNGQPQPQPQPQPHDEDPSIDILYDTLMARVGANQVWLSTGHWHIHTYSGIAYA